MLRKVLDFLFASDLPVALQVFWKILVLSMVVALVYAALTVKETGGVIICSVLACIFFVVLIFGKLGEE